MATMSPRTFTPALVILVLLIAVSAGCNSTGAGTGTDEDVTLYKRGGITIAIPDEYAHQLLIDPGAAYEDETTLIKIYQKSAYEKYNGMGFLFSVDRFTQAQYELFLGSDGSGRSFFARDDAYYYGFFIATDVQTMPEDSENFKKLLSAVGDYVKRDMITRHSLTAYSDSEFFDRDYTYDSEHIFIDYYPYYAFNGSKEAARTLILSQPVTRGDKGIWCVERWKDDNGNIYPYFPAEDGIPSAQYYSGLQAGSDTGRDTSWLDPEQAALAFAKKYFGHPGATAESFSLSVNQPSPATD